MTIIYIGGGAYEAQRLVPPQNLGPGGTLWSVPPQIFAVIMLLDLESKPGTLAKSLS